MRSSDGPISSFVAERLPAGQWRCASLGRDRVTGYAATPEQALAVACRTAGLDPERYRAGERGERLVVFEVPSADGGAADR